MDDDDDDDVEEEVVVEEENKLFELGSSKEVSAVEEE